MLVLFPGAVVKMNSTRSGSAHWVSAMQTVKILETSAGQAVPLPAEFRFDTPVVSIRRQGDAVILEPVRAERWPEHFFDNIHIDDPAFARPDQGSAPPAPTLD